jgi:hypothetical protein
MLMVLLTFIYMWRETEHIKVKVKVRRFTCFAKTGDLPRTHNHSVGELTDGGKYVRKRD